MGAKHARNYYRGWGEWGSAADTPSVAAEALPAAERPLALASDAADLERVLAGLS